MMFTHHFNYISQIGPQSIVSKAHNKTQIDTQINRICNIVTS